KASAANAAVGLGNFVLADGSFDIARRAVTVTDAAIASGAPTLVSLLDVNIGSASVFAGVGGSFNPDHSIAHGGATGFYVTGVGLEAAVVKPQASGAADQTSFTGLQATVGSASLEGINGVTLSSTATTFQVNMASDSTGATSSARLDWTTAFASTANPAGSVPVFSMDSSVSDHVHGSVLVN